MLSPLWPTRRWYTRLWYPRLLVASEQNAAEAAATSDLLDLTSALYRGVLSEKRAEVKVVMGRGRRVVIESGTLAPYH
jgi:hypothetical protein